MDHAFRDLVSEWPLPLSMSVSPDQKKLFLQGASADGKSYLLQTLQLDSKRSTYLPLTTPELRPRWSPNSLELAFMSFGHTGVGPGRELHIWNTVSGIDTTIPLPYTTGNPQVDWSPSGKYIGYTDSQQDNLFIVDVQNRTVRQVSDLRIKTFSWSPDDTKLAIVETASPNDLSVVNNMGKTLVRIKSFRGEPIRDLFWSRSVSGIYVESSESESKEKSHLDLVTPGTKHWTPIIETDGILDKLAVSATSRAYAIEVVSGSSKRYLYGTVGRQSPHSVPYVADNDTLEAISADGGSLYSLHVDSSPPSERVIAVRDGRVRTIYERRPRHLPIVNSSTYWVASANKLSVPVILWRAPRSGSPHRVIIFVHGAPHGHIGSTWNEQIEMCLARGFDVAVVNYRGSSGYTAAWSKMEDSEGAAQDVGSACEYLHHLLGVSYNDITVLGNSAGAEIAVRAYMLHPNYMGTLVLVSFYKYAGESNLLKRPESPVKILIFHPEWDRIDLAATKRLISRVLGPSLLQKRPDNLYVVPNEEHQMSDARGWAFVLGNLFEQLGVLPC